MMEQAGANYFISQFSFGDLAQDEVLHSAGIFARELLPMAGAAQPAGNCSSKRAPRSVGNSLIDPP